MSSNKCKGEMANDSFFQDITQSDVFTFLILQYTVRFVKRQKPQVDAVPTLDIHDLSCK